MRISNRRAFIAVTGCVALLGASHSARAQCTKDIECKGDRICSGGACVDPAPAAPLAPLPAPAEPAPPPAQAGAEATSAEASSPAGPLAHAPAASDDAGPTHMRSPAMRTTGIVLSGLGAVGAIVSTILIVKAHNDRQGLAADCPNSVCTSYELDRWSRANSEANAATVTSLITISLLGAGIPLYFVGAHQVPAQGTARWWVPQKMSVGAGRATLTFAF